MSEVIDANKIDVDYPLERLSGDKDYLAESSVRVCDTVTAELIDNPNSLIENRDTVELSIRNSEVLRDRIRSSIDISGVSEKTIKDLDILESKAGGLLTACGINFDEYDSSDSGTLSALQRKVADGKLPVESVGLLVSILKESTTWFADTISDNNVSIDPSLQRYFAGNTRAVALSARKNN